MKPFPYTLTSESVTVVVDGTPHTFQKGTPNFEGLRSAIFNEKWADIPRFLTVASSIEEWAKGEFTVKGEVVSYKGKVLPTDLNSRIVEMACKGENPTPLFRFWERLQKNPSWRSVQQLWAFLKNRGIPIDEDGYLLAYKAVTADLKDCHTGTIDNTPGAKNEMERNLVSDDPEVACHFGYHVGALEYARSFGGASSRIVICKVDPADVVCVPKDASYQKMRVCAYEVMGHHAGGFLPSTTFKEDIEDDDNGCNDNDCEGDDFNDDEGEAPVRRVKKGKKAKKVAPKPKVADAAKVVSTSDVGIVCYDKLFAEMDKEDSEPLMKRDLATLRRYAALHLKIVGASKIPGGKPSLVTRILTVRG